MDNGDDMETTTTTGLRKRASCAISSSSSSKKETDGSDIILLSSPRNTSRPLEEDASCCRRWTRHVSLFLHLVALSIFISGFFLRINLHNGEECEMTYSMRQFLELETPSSFVHSSAATNRYKLYKFVDRRDPRFQQILREKQPLTSGYCGNNNNNQTSNRIVLYVPGHWGSYTQSRSVGAHGIQLTGQGNGGLRKVQEALANNLWTGDATDEEKFVYDVYSVDFAEQGGALHGQFLRLQSDFVASVVQHLAVGKKNGRHHLLMTIQINQSVVRCLLTCVRVPACLPLY
jgi:hypothetical protein